LSSTTKMPFELSGKPAYQVRSTLNFFWSMLFVSLRRLFRGPRLPNWKWDFEVSIYFTKLQTSIAFEMPNMADGRAYEDSFTFASPAADEMVIEPVTSPVQGHWFRPKSGTKGVTVLYLHGGGYAYYSKAHKNLIALVTKAAESQTFALDYRLIPEHTYPAQLDDALAAYHWLLETGIHPEHLVIAGDSAGGNLTLALLLSLRDAKLPLPILGVCIAPWTDVENSGKSLKENEPFDWVDARMPIQWAKWLCKDADPRNPIVSPINADLRDLPPIYIQEGDAEILYDMIHAFSEKAKSQGAAITLDVWPHMNHDFQAFGDMLPESKEALKRIGQVIKEHIG
jgi:epsilon-lactone hydrolase